MQYEEVRIFLRRSTGIVVCVIKLYKAERVLPLCKSQKPSIRCKNLLFIEVCAPDWVVYCVAIGLMHELTGYFRVLPNIGNIANLGACFYVDFIILLFLYLRVLVPILDNM